MVCGRCAYSANGADGLQLFCKPLNERSDRLLQLRERYAGVAKQRELDGEANAIGVPPAAATSLIGS